MRATTDGGAGRARGRRARTGRPGWRRAFWLCLAGLLTGCGGWIGGGDGPPRHPIDPYSIPDAVPHPEPRSRLGNPASYVVNGHRYYVLASARGYVERGIASWYGTKFHGRRTSSGEPYDMYAMTAAHKTLPLPTYVRVTNLRNGRSVVVRVNDRGPFHPNRIIDLSWAAAAKLGILGHGTGLVEVRALDPRHPEQPRVRSAERHGPGVVPVAAGGARAPRIFLQLGAFVDRHNAERLQRRLQQRWPRVHIEAGISRGQRIYRVRLGPLRDVDEADRLTALIQDMGLEEPHVVID